MIDAFLYFAYGSNMLTERLRARCPSARPLCVGRAHGHALEFSKRSVDGSGKATLVAVDDQSAVVPGVLFKIAHADQPRLDAAEGVGIGYDRHDGFAVTCDCGDAAAVATVYIAPEWARDSSLAPYDWYMALNVAGALQHGLPAAHVAGLRGLDVRPDPAPRRGTRQEALAVLRQAGFERMFDLEA